MRNDRLGEKRLMNCGMEAEIITYNNSSDINIKFEDEQLQKIDPIQIFAQGRLLIPKNY